MLWLFVFIRLVATITRQVCDKPAPRGHLTVEDKLIESGS